jgi:hypothetical protein
MDDEVRVTTIGDEEFDDEISSGAGISELSPA